MNTGFGYTPSPTPVVAQTLANDSVLQVPDSVSSLTGSPTMVLIVLIGLLWLFKIVGDSPKSGIEPGHIFVGPYNLVLVTITSILGISLSKIIFNQVHVPGVTDLVNAI